MKTALMTCSLLAATTQAALADSCQDRFTELYLQLDQGVPIKAEVTSVFTGYPPTKNDFYYIGPDHYMTVPTSPAGPRVVGYNNVLFQSSDEGASWVKVREMDTSQNADKALDDKRTNAKTIRNAVCADEELNGEPVSTIAADITITQGSGSENRYTYWVRQSDDFIVKAVYDSKSEDFESLTTQVIEKAPDLVLPTPE